MHSCESQQVPAQFKALMGPDRIPTSTLPDSAIVPVCSDTEPSWHLETERENIRVPGQCSSLATNEWETP